LPAIARQRRSPRAGSPDAPDAVLIEHVIVADETDVFELRLRDEHPVERIPMVARESARALCVQDRDVERRKTLTADPAEHIVGNVLRQGVCRVAPSS
jgi:hypothetical protein